MVTHDQEEALSVADRIVVMNQGVIEQVGTPLEIYREPASPFVADFVGKVNVLPARVAGGELRFGSLCMPCDGADREARVYLRPEDVLARPIADGDPHVFDASIEKIEFLGSYCHVRVASPALDANKLDRVPLAQFPVRAVAGGGLAAAAQAAARAHEGVLMAAVLPSQAPQRRRSGNQRTGPTASRTWRCSSWRWPWSRSWRCRCSASCCRRCRAGTGQFVGLANFIAYAADARAAGSLWNSVWVSALVTVITVPLAFGFAYALTRSCMPLKPLFRGITLIPLLAPSLLSAISLIYWFGNQGVLKSWLNGLGIAEIYGAPGIVLAECFAVFPHALMILVTALSLSDARLYEAADAMGTSAARKFFTITLPGAKYGLISAALVTFTLVITDFGIPKVIGGNFNVLATDVFKLVIGQQDFAKGAVVAILLLAPAVLTFAVDGYVQRSADRHADGARRALRAQARAALRRGDDAVLRAHRACWCWRCSAWRCSPRSRASGPTTSRPACATT